MKRRDGGPAARRARAWLLVLAAVLGCTAGGVAREELEQPEIAVVYWDREAARERAEASAPQAAGPGRLGVARIDDIGRLLGAGGESAAELERRFPGRLSLVDPATGVVRPIEQAPRGAVPLAWSSDRRALLVAAPLRGALQLFEYRTDVDELRPVTSGPAMHARGDYGPGDGLAVASQDRREGARVELRPPGAAPRRTLLRGGGIDDVRWSPRGDMLALAVVDPTRRDRDGEFARLLFTLPADAPPQSWPPGPGSKLSPLGRGREPVFSADGEWIVYSARVGDGWRLRRVHAAGGSKRALGKGVRDEFEPAVSPDGSLVAFVSEENGLDRLFVRRMDGTGDRLLLPHGAVARPVW